MVSVNNKLCTTFSGSEEIAANLTSFKMACNILSDVPVCLKIRSIGLYDAGFLLVKLI